MNTLNKKQIKDIKYFINCEVEQHKFGYCDKFKITSLRIHANGDYSFKVHWMLILNNNNEDYWVNGNLFNEFPIFSVIDGLDAVQLLFHNIHQKAYEREIKYMELCIEINNENLNYLKHIYTPGGAYNKENKNIQ